MPIFIAAAKNPDGVNQYVAFAHHAPTFGHGIAAVIVAAIGERVSKLSRDF